MRWITMFHETTISGVYDFGELIMLFSSLIFSRLFGFIFYFIWISLKNEYWDDRGEMTEVGFFGRYAAG